MQGINQEKSFPDFGDFEAWIKTQGGQKGLAAKILEATGEKIGQPAISGWIRNRRVPVERRALLKKFGWPGPWDWNGAAEEPASTGILPEHVQEAYIIVRDALEAAKVDISTMDRERVGLVIGLAAEEVSKGNREEARRTLIRRAEVLLGLRPS